MHELHELVGLLCNRLFVQLLLLQTKRNIIPYGQMREDRIVLEHHTDITLCRIEIIDPFIVKVNIAALNTVESGNHSE